MRKDYGSYAFNYQKRKEMMEQHLLNNSNTMQKLMRNMHLQQTRRINQQKQLKENESQSHDRLKCVSKEKRRSQSALGSPS